MVFSSLTFLTLFLPLVLLAYYLTPRRGKNAVLFAASLLFYAWGEPVYILLMIFSTVLDYVCGRLTERFRGTNKAKLGLIISLCGNIGLLAVFKYSDFIITLLNGIFRTNLPMTELPLPIGISFCTFQTMSYTVDVYRGDVKAQRNFITFGAYVSLFPQLIAGPIVRYRDVAEQLTARIHSADKFGEGVRRFVTGLGKKVLLANNIGLLWETTSSGGLTVVSAWLGIIAFAFQIYFDFSGYSDMAVGLGKMLGFDFPENFNYPYVSKSVTEFWRRWHISLGGWFRDYVYIPLGGSRKGLPIQLRNIAAVWLLTGLWHGASWNFLLWGAFYGALLMIEKLFLLKALEKTPAFVGHVYTLFATLAGFTIFAFEDMEKCGTFLKATFGGAELIGGNALYLLLSYLPLLLVCAFAATPLSARLCRKFNEKTKNGTLSCAANITAMAAVMLLCTAYLVSGSYNPFLYFRF
ncbi:MAG: MBOAT family protein [Lachnospiraceae bacterium]|nr:MBOAT family protein [Ruminococcus sp.]MCM1276380.1 MBOAT family protein [Lachnospiraceae bacterium]